MKPRVLFILKFRDEYGYSSGGLSSGLYNSARFMVQMLTCAGIDARLVQVIDNNDIDREVFLYKPTHVVIEALWVVPEKFDILQDLHPNVEWIVRNHSEIPFLAQEGVALDWYVRYLFRRNVSIASNSRRSWEDLKKYVSESFPSFARKVLYLPNFYPPRQTREPIDWERKFLHVGCFGALRVLKNQLLQAMAAGRFAAQLSKRMVFHITDGGTNDSQAGSILRNLRAYIRHTDNRLEIHPWQSHAEFLDLVETMDVVMQVSFSETFDIVAADAVSLGVPVVVSPEIRWASFLAATAPTDSDGMVRILSRVLDPLAGPVISLLNRRGLASYSHESREIWLKFLFS